MIRRGFLTGIIASVPGLGWLASKANADKEIVGGLNEFNHYFKGVDDGFQAAKYHLHRWRPASEKPEKAGWLVIVRDVPMASEGTSRFCDLIYLFPEGLSWPITDLTCWMPLPEPPEDVA